VNTKIGVFVNTRIGKVNTRIGIVNTTLVVAVHRAKRTQSRWPSPPGCTPGGRRVPDARDYAKWVSLYSIVEFQNRPDQGSLPRIRTYT
jgi:hypothetical protein